MRQPIVVACLIVGLIASGCQKLPGVEHTARSEPSAVRMKDDATYYLVEWQPHRAPSTNPTTVPTLAHGPRQYDIRRAKVVVHAGDWVGFNRPTGELVAFAGPVKWTLPEGHYSWFTRTRSNPMRPVGEAAGRALGFTLTAVGVAALVTAIVWLELHTPQDRDCGCVNGS
jgi:hypothetical protein